MSCPVCGYKTNQEFRFCPSCGSELPVQEKKLSSLSDIVNICEVCGEESDNNSEFCRSCGAKIDRQKAVSKPAVQKPVSSKPEKESSTQKAQVNRDKNRREKDAPRKPSPVISAERKFSTLNIVLIITGFLLLGYVILDIAGVFDKPAPVQVTGGEQTQGSAPQINMADLERIEQLEKSLVADSTNMNVILELAHKLGDSGFNDRAVKYYEMYLRRNPDNADVNVDLGVVFFELKQYDKAKSRMLKGISLNPRHQIAHFNIGVVNSAEQKLDSAKIWWKRAVDINPATEIGRRAQELLNSH